MLAATSEEKTPGPTVNGRKGKWSEWSDVVFLLREASLILLGLSRTHIAKVYNCTHLVTFHLLIELGFILPVLCVLIKLVTCMWL